MVLQERQRSLQQPPGAGMQQNKEEESKKVAAFSGKSCEHNCFLHCLAFCPRILHPYLGDYNLQVWLCSERMEHTQVRYRPREAGEYNMRQGRTWMTEDALK